MKPSDAIDWIRSTFKNPLEGNELCHSISEERFIEVLDAIEKRLPPSSGPTGISIRQFLYYGCVKFSRWFAPSPYVLADDQRKNYDRFVKNLCISEPDTTNTATFLVAQAKWDLYSLLDHKSKEDIQSCKKEIDAIEEMIDKIRPPQIPNKLDEYLKVYHECKSIMSGARDNSLHTSLKTRLPINPISEPCIITTRWKGINATIFLTPNWIEPPNSFIKGEGLTAIPQTPSQWQHGYCEVVIDVEALLDSATGSIPLAVCPDQELPGFDRWPVVFVDVFDLLDSLIWKLREEQKIPGNWLLHPNDIATLEIEVKVNQNRLDWLMKGPPGLVMRYTNVKPEIKKIEIENALKTEWYIRCKILAETFISTGETNEALFWLNVGIEALFEKRVTDICISNNIDYESLASGKAYWERAESIVAEQFPKIANQIEWPDAAVGSPSWFTKIRYLSKHLSLRHSTTEILKNYRIINEHRNALFHGFGEDNVSIKTVVEALDAFIWLEQNFC